MANTKPTDSPAYIIIGVKDVPEEGHRIPKGIEKHHDDARLQDLVKDKVEPAPTFLYQSITYEGKQFGVIEIQPGYRLYQCRKNFGLLKAGVFYTRKGSTNQEATADDLEELLRDKARHMRDRTLEELSFMRRASQQQFDEAGSWTPRWFVQDLKVDKGVVDQRIQVGRLVVVKFQGKPSRKWKDPAAEIQGFWEQSREVMIPITRPLIAVRHDDIEMGEVKAEYVPLCIPGLDVDVEWREETQLEGQLWGSIKRYVVQKFLKACEGKNMICRVIYVGSSERGIYYHLNSPDYDQYLIYEWPYYKGL
ncbi:ATP-binding protein [Dehalococcoidia bacterium]|nr:ATP-binding protein [Dehalococcoidia bacterium]